MENHFIKSASSDISFCMSACQNKKCDRNLKGRLHLKLIDDWVSYGEFYKDCTEYKPKKGKRE